MQLFLVKATLLLLLALGISRVLRRASASARHLVWLGALGALCVLPALSTWTPISLAILPGAPTVPRLTSAGAVAVRNAALPGSAGAPAVSAPDAMASVREIPSMSGVVAAKPGALARFSGWVAARPTQAFVALWLAVAAALLSWLAYGTLVVRRIVRRARPRDAAEWSAPLLEIADRLGLSEPPRLLRSADTAMPFACGFFRPTIVLPADSDTWTADRRRAVLLHELGHVRRRDLVGHTLGRLACVAYWFHPLVWTAAKQLRVESERACDDLALTSGARASDYAEHLLDIVTAIRAPGTPAVALAMARRNEFEGRMLAILDPRLPRRGPGRAQAAGLIGLMAIAALLIGAAAPVRRSRPPDRAAVPPTPPAARADAAAPSGVAVPTHTREHTRVEFDTTTSTAMHRSTRTAYSSTMSESGAAPQPNGAAKPSPSPNGARPAAQRTDAGADDRSALLAQVLRTDTSASLRRVAAWGLSQYSDDAAGATALAAALKGDADPAVREMAAWSLGETGARGAGVEALQAAVRQDADPRVRATAAWALGEIGDDDALPALSAALSSPDADVRVRAVWAMGEIGGDRAPAALTAMLHDSEPRMRRVTAWALYQIGDASAAPALDSALTREKDDTVRRALIRAMASMGEKSVDTVRRLIDSKDPEVRSLAIRVLAGDNVSPWPWPWPDPRPSP